MSATMRNARMTRRGLLSLVATAGVGLLAAACQPKVVEVTTVVEKVIKETVVQEKVVEKEKEVTKVVEKQKEVTKVVEVEKVVAPTAGPKLIVWAPKHFIQRQNEYYTDSILLTAAQNNFSAEVQMFPWGDYQQKQNAAIEAGTLPDVLLGISVSRYYAMKILTDVTDLYTDLDKDGGGFYEANKNGVMVDGKAWGIPFHNEPQVMYYRADIFSKAGYTMPPKDMTEFVVACKAVTNPAQNIFGFGNTFGNTPDGNNVFWPILWAFGGKVQDESGKIVFNSPEAVAAVTWFTDLYKKDKIMPPAVTGWDDTGNNKAWLAGQCACIYNSGSILYAMRTTDPGFAKDTVVGPTPAGPKGPKTFSGGSTYGIMKGTKNIDRAALLIKGTMSADRYPVNMETAGGMFYPVLQNYAKIPFYETDAWNKQVAATLPYTQYAFEPGKPEPWIDEIGGLWMWSEMLASVALKDVDPKEAVAAAEKKLIELQQKYANQ